MKARPSVQRFSVVPKMHYAYHLCQQAKLANPKLRWAYGGEDFVGKVSGLAHTCLAGTATFRVPDTLLQKYSFAMHMRFRKRL